MTTPTTPLPDHGGAIDTAMRRYGIPTARWIDLSTGINPVPYPVGDVADAIWHRLPLAHDVAALKTAAAKYYQIPDTRFLCTAPGTQAIIQVLPFMIARHFSGRRVMVAGPTYGEHALAWHRAGFEIIPLASAPGDRADDIRNRMLEADIVVLVNPNNPDGGFLSNLEVRKLARDLEAAGKWLILDEAFSDTVPDATLCPAIADLNRTIILRSFGKFFGLAGLRLGFAVANPDITADLEDRLGPWAVSGPAIEIATRAFEDHDWQTQTRQRLAQDAARMDNLITEKTGLKLVGGTDLFRLFNGNNCAQTHDHLARHGIWVRAFADHPDRLRFGLPGTEHHWQRLQTALSSMDTDI